MSVFPSNMIKKNITIGSSDKAVQDVRLWKSHISLKHSLCSSYNL